MLAAEVRGAVLQDSFPAADLENMGITACASDGDVVGGPWSARTSSSSGSRAVPARWASEAPSPRRPARRARTHALADPVLIIDDTVVGRRIEILTEERRAAASGRSSSPIGCQL
jgi:hypothetical protein